MVKRSSSANCQPCVTHGYEDLQKVQCPTLIITSRNDQMRSVAESQLMADRIPHSQLAIIEHSGHMTPLEKPVALLEILTRWFRDNVKNV